MLTGFPLITYLLLQTDLRPLSAAAAVLKTNNKVLIAGEPFYLQPQTVNVHYTQSP